jgi:hypothetical protein
MSEQKPTFPICRTFDMGSESGCCPCAARVCMPSETTGHDNLQDNVETGASGLEPATSGVTGRVIIRRHSTPSDMTRRRLTRIDWVGSHRARTAVVGFGTAAPKDPANGQLLAMERAGFEPAASGLQTHPDATRHLTALDRTGVVEPKSPFSSNAARHVSTVLCSHRARTAAA